jgi:hypothetical protein
MKPKFLSLSISTTLLVLSLSSCSKHYFRSNYRDSNALMHETENLKTKPFLKAHMKDGTVSILKDSWHFNASSQTISGAGSTYGINRNKIFEGNISIPVDSVAIFETNEKIINREAKRITALGILTGVDIIGAVLCLANPKACFGSCPTFYINENHGIHYANAEGFSNAIAPSMEYGDIDALNNEPIKDHTFSVIMKNEALETHCVNEILLFAHPRAEQERIFHTPDNEFYKCKKPQLLTRAEYKEENITGLLQSQDNQEWFSYADSSNLICKEEIILYFDNIEKMGNPGLVLSFRQTLMTTYLIYSALGYMGDEVADIFAALETQEKKRNKLKSGIGKELGDIEIYIWDERKNTWIFENRFNETGPIALNTQIVPLTKRSPGKEIKIKIVLNKGLWRIDHVALLDIVEKVQPFKIAPKIILNKGEVDQKAKEEISNPEDHLISMPGSEYTFIFELPEAYQDYELFLYSKGYYLEWMRSVWLKEKNLRKLRQMLENPQKYLKEEAASYKIYEQNMEEVFWNSRIDTKIYSFYEK